MTKSAPVPWQQIYVRHVIAERRQDVTRLASIVKPTFESSSSGSEGAGEGIWSKPQGRWLIGAGFAGSDWVPLFTNYETATELFVRNGGNKRLEVALTGYDPEHGGWFFWLNQGGKKRVRFFQSSEPGSPARWDVAAEIRPLLDDCQTAQAAWQVLCQYFDVPKKTCTIVEQEGRFIVLGKNGQPIKPTTRGVISYHGPEIAAGENKAADQLNEAIEQGDAQAVRQAVAAGASLEVRPDSSVSPLLAALFKWFKPGSREVAEALVELGASLNGRPGADPPLIDLMHGFVQDELSFAAAEFLLKQGADVNATNEQGKTALFQAVVCQKQECVELLMKFGADPHLGGTLDWLQNRMEKTSDLVKLKSFGQLRELLTGQPWQAPPVPELSPELQAENERFRQVHELWQIEQVLKNGFQILRSRNTELTHHPTVQHWVEQLKRLGFQRACQVDLWLGLHCRSYRVLTDSQRNMDALITLGNEANAPLRLDLGVYHPEGQLTTVSNYERESFLGYIYPGNDFTCLPEADAIQLVELLEQKLAESPRAVLPIEPATFESRYRELNEREIKELLAHLQTLLKTPPDLQAGTLPRYERLHCYLRGHSDSDPTWSTAELTNYALQDLAEELPAEPMTDHSLPFVIRSAVDLVLLKHLQVAGAPQELTSLPLGCQRAVQLFERQAARSKPYHKTWLVEELEESLLLTSLAGDWSAFSRICAALRPRFADPAFRISDTPTVEAAQFWLIVASAFRTRKIPGVAQLREQVRQVRKKRYPLLLDLWEAIEARSQEDFETALLLSLKHQQTRRDRADSLYELRRLLALPETILYQIALHQGLTPCKLPDPLADRLVAPVASE